MYGFLLRSGRFETDAGCAPSHPVVCGVASGMDAETEGDELAGPLRKVEFDGGCFSGFGRQVNHVRSVNGYREGAAGALGMVDKNAGLEDRAVVRGGSVGYVNLEGQTARAGRDGVRLDGGG